ncbi:tetratricopeptide repeat protein [Usitatibacter palustris]|uniref:Tetratricopeptide repeat protein 38 n=1 Tax=Usitatibacter palustris TaxID=2732487 RepID=A0A6M4H6B9_9PROT|nr:tetratricopeptide repeat protein [Usitatibacter palustris]QJR14735.1 hypothetical protein DSM104440_01545 [Usitatibacter palustris]
MLRDSRGLTVSTSSTQALAAYENGLRAVLSFTGDPLAPLDQAIAADPAFAGAYVAKALALITAYERRFAKMAIATLDAGKRAIDKGTDRERALAAAARRLAEDDWHGGVAAIEDVLVANPRDILALQVGHLFDFVRGDALNLRNRVTRVLPHWSANDPEFAYVLGMHAFGLEECNQYPEAEDTGLRALELQPLDSWAVHAVTHVMEMQGRIEEGIQFLETRQEQWAPADNAFQFHNWWHLALFNVDQGNFARALAIHDDHLAGALEMAMSRVDATAMLWRLKLEGVEIGDRMESVADSWEKDLGTEAGYAAFNDFHGVLSFAATGRKTAIKQAREELQSSLGAASSNADMARFVGRPASEAAIAYSEERFADAVDLLRATRDISARFGGSHAQRDILTLTLIDAATRAGQLELARHYTQERLVSKPTALWGRRLFERTKPKKQAA